MERLPEEGYLFVYIITEFVGSDNEFFKVIFEALLNSDAINKLSRVSAQFREVASSIMDRVKKVYNVELRERGETDYYALLTELFASLKNNLDHIVIQIDEFPQTIQNIFKNEGRDIAEKFIQKNRALRHHEELAGKVQFIYTGSLSLYPIVEQVTNLTAVNDLRPVELQALSIDEAGDFLLKLLQEENFELDSPMINYVLDKIKWLIPFHIQLIAQEIIEVYEAEGVVIDKPAVDKAFDQILHVRNRAQFEPYFVRLSTVFLEEELDCVMEILKYVALNNQITEAAFLNLGKKYRIQDIQRIKNILEGDGYLYYNQKDEIYCYISPMLQLWCRKHICR